jgi:hypothetical protein
MVAKLKANKTKRVAGSGSSRVQARVHDGVQGDKQATAHPSDTVLASTKNLLSSPVSENPGGQAGMAGVDGNIDAEKFFNIVMNAAKMMMNDELSNLKRDVDDLKIFSQRLRKKQAEYEIDYKALGFTISELGLVELGILNKTKNMMRDKLAVVMSNGQIRGRTDTTRYNVVPVGIKPIV